MIASITSGLPEQSQKLTMISAVVDMPNLNTVLLLSMLLSGPRLDGLLRRWFGDYRGSYFLLSPVLSDHLRDLDCVGDEDGAVLQDQQGVRWPACAIAEGAEPSEEFALLVLPLTVDESVGVGGREIF